MAASGFLYAIIALVMVAAVGWYAQRQEAKERAIRPGIVDDDQARQAVSYIRQDIRVVAFLLMAILVMLGLIADRLH